MTTIEPDLVSKSDFAKLSNVSAGRVSQWISEGKISGDALVGTGQRARIRRSIAQEQLRARLDVNQRFGLNGLGTRLAVPAVEIPSHLPLDQPARIPAPVDIPTNDTDERIKLENLRQRQITTRKMLEEEQARAGRFVLADDVQRQLNVAAEQMMSQFMGALPDLANALAAEYGLVVRDVLHTLRTAFRTIRTEKAHALGAEAEALPATVEQPIADATR